MKKFSKLTAQAAVAVSAPTFTSVVQASNESPVKKSGLSSEMDETDNSRGYTKL